MDTDEHRQNRFDGLVDEWVAGKNARVSFANPPIHLSNNPDIHYW
jgi:hypothetical protein